MFGHIPSLPLAGIFGLGTGELVLIILLVLLLFGAKRIPELARGLAKSIQEFKKASKEAETEIRQSVQDQPQPPPPANKPSSTPPPAASN
jgi:sec-independent protein translocase protein TatA